MSKYWVKIEQNGAVSVLCSEESDYWEQYKNSDCELKLVTFEEYSALEREFYCKPAEVISEEEWYKMLEVLPPEQWHTDSDGVNKFNMSERTSGSITAQYARYNGVYLCKNVDLCDKSTNIGIADFFPDALKVGQEVISLSSYTKIKIAKIDYKEKMYVGIDGLAVAFDKCQLSGH